jgi:hypothetical protein
LAIIKDGGAGQIPCIEFRDQLQTFLFGDDPTPWERLLRVVQSISIERDEIIDL